MSVVCFASLKGGVGKTSLSLNVAHAFAKRGCETLLIDLDPSAHASRLLQRNNDEQIRESPLAKLFLSLEEVSEEEVDSLLDKADELGITQLVSSRDRLKCIPSGPEVRHFLWGRGARVFRTLFPKLIGELNQNFDFIIIDTPPDFNNVVRNCIASSDLVMVPVDSSEMSVRCLEEITRSASHIKGPTWAIVRSMLNRQASRIHRLSMKCLGENITHSSLKNPVDQEFDSAPAIDAQALENADEFLAFIEENEAPDENSTDSSPIYLLDSIVYRSERQNQLSFEGRTAFDLRSTRFLAEQYDAVAREIESLVVLSEDLVDTEDMGEFCSVNREDSLGAPQS